MYCSWQLPGTSFPVTKLQLRKLISLARQFFFVQNFAFDQNVGLAFAWFATTWSLAVEEQFYLVSPFLVRFLSTRSLSIVLGSAVLAAPFIRFFARSHMSHGSLMAYALTPCRVDDLAFGMLVAIAWRNPSVRQWLSSHVAAIHSLLGFLFIGAIGWWKWEPDLYRVAMQWVNYTWIGLFFTVLLLAVLVRPASLLGWVTRVQWLRELRKSFVLRVHYPHDRQFVLSYLNYGRMPLKYRIGSVHSLPCARWCWRMRLPNCLGSFLKIHYCNTDISFDTRNLQ